MYISRIRLRNFRSFRSAEFRFGKGVNTLIGENGSGKTNAFHAIRLLLDESISRSATRLRESDFNRALPNGWRGEWVIIGIHFEDLDTSEGCQILRHNAGHMDGTNTGTYTFIFRPNIAVRKKLFELTESGADADEVRAALSDITIDNYEGIFTGRATANFLDDNDYHSLAGNVGELAFPAWEDDAARIGDRVYAPLHQEVSCTFVKALRDVVSELRNFRDSPLLNLLRGAERKIELADAERIVKSIKELNNDISSLEEIRAIARDVQDTLHDTVGHTYSPSIDIRSAIPDELERLLQRLCLAVSDSGDDGYSGELDELSLGGANLIYLSLKLLEYENKTATDRVAHFLLIEEPESHIHTHIQKTLFEKYAYDNTQVIVSTHSTHISAASRIGSVNILSKSLKEAEVFHPAAGLDETQRRRLERYLDAVRSTLLFAKGVILVEGDAELVVVPTLVKQIFGQSLDEMGISLINMSSTVFRNIADLFGEERVRRCCAILTDLDRSIVALPADAKDDDEFQKGCRASEVSGQQRKKALDEACATNPWVRVCYSPHTFEVDFLTAGNVDTVVAVLPNIYQKDALKTKSQTALASADIAVAGREILRLAQSVGKGWLAVLLAEKVTPSARMPEHILAAVAFAAWSGMDRRSLIRMANYRCSKHHAEGASRIAVLKAINTGDVDRVKAVYVEKYPDDELTRFIKLLG